ncbi:MAG: cytochrome c oxidase subunit 3 [Crocinitomicaceae bacterium]|nr:cytochrome c oxidase subunit 3 [Crocinitomicaceae bacterium]
MAGHASKQIDSKTLWGGKMSPFSTSYGKLMMWFFLVSDALTFGGLLIAYGFTRHDYLGSWPIGEETFNSMPFLGHGFPLLYVALMTFILIISSVTMVLAVEAGHRMDKRGVIKWMIATIVGGFFFVGSQAWEWSHFIHGSEFGKVEIYDGSIATVHGTFGEIENFHVIVAGEHHEAGSDIIAGEHGMTQAEMMHMYQHAVAEGNVVDNVITLHDGSQAEITKMANTDVALYIKETGGEYEMGHHIEGAEAVKFYEDAVNSGDAGRIVYGANLQENEYGPQQYGQFFFFITGFHGFHVFSGVMINILILMGVVRGVYHKRGHYEMVEKTGLYWHFVDLVWVFVFTFFYLV